MEAVLLSSELVLQRGSTFTRLVLCACLGSLTAPAQDAPPPAASAAAADRFAPATREETIEWQRRQKAAALEPETNPPPERVLNYIKQHRIIERFTNGVAGLRVRLGGLTTGSGFAVGPEFYRRSLLHEQLRFRASTRASLKQFYLMETELDMPRLGAGHVFVNLYGVHRRYPRVDYYGPGANSSKSGRSDFLLEDTSFQSSAGIQPFKALRMGGTGRYLMVNIGPGRDERFVSSNLIYNEQAAPGINQQTNYFEGGGFLEFDWRDNPGGPRSGGYYGASFSSFSDVDLKRYSFSRLNMEVQQYIPFFNQRRVIALRARVQASDPHGGNLVPFYLQPTLGGSEDLRGFRPFRFYDNNSALLQGEYRWEVFSGLDMALFMDAGRVFSRWNTINFRQLEKDFGFGFRFNVRNDVFLRIDTGFSREGFQVWFKFNNVF